MTGQPNLPPAGQRPVRRAAITNLGCKVNQAEMDVLERLLRSRGVEIVGAGEPADLHVVNTCTVTAAADEKSRKAVRRARRTSPAARLVVTGCAAQVAPGAFAAADPAAHLVDNRAKASLVEDAEGLLGPATAGAGVAGTSVADEGRARIDRTRAFIKVQDGCSFHCTYCAIPAARGPEASITPEAVLRDVRQALAAGHREIVLTGINVGTYDGGWSERGFRGSHARSALTLGGLVRRILRETPIERIRLSSIEPQHIDDDVLEAWAVEGAGRCLPHFHVPLQSGDDGVLRRMGRRYDTASYGAVVDRVRAALPGVAIHADVIAGFPTEDDALFERSLAFIRQVDLAGLHAFRYSARPGTPATRMAGQVAEPVRRERVARLVAEGAACRARFAAAAAGGTRRVLVEGRCDRGDPALGWIGHAEDYLAVRVAGAGVAQAGDLAVVAIAGPDPGDAGRVVGRIRRLVPRPTAGWLIRGVPFAEVGRPDGPVPAAAGADARPSVPGAFA